MKRRTKLIAGVGAGLAVAGGALAFLLVQPGPVLLDPDDFPGVVASQQGEPAVPPGWTNCDLSVGAWLREGDPDTLLDFGDGSWAVAAIAQRPEGRNLYADADAFIAHLESTAATCAQSSKIDNGFTIEALPDLDPGAVGWRTGYLDIPRWGEYVVIPLDERRLLAVGFETNQEEPPVDMDRLVELAKQGAEQFPAEE
ncbi:hypothetical protein [Cellulomonas triticagri]|uniref:Uncharacterized protein n=1 Tax=Cellulomonas triticagri TaxID=2483352 RepID=A0A3M2JKC3_9CELL|nr:hypothetical protein [Cellulomonas triticagri]RMI13564.1 hypothetical protein EBM89_03910 [Cellulomonas triticagri]